MPATISSSRLGVQDAEPLQEPFRGHTPHLHEVSSGFRAEAVSIARCYPQLVDLALELRSPRRQRNHDANGRSVECWRTDHSDRTVSLEFRPDRSEVRPRSRSPAREREPAAEPGKLARGDGP